jgi:hypothetical protein
MRAARIFHRLTVKRTIFTCTCVGVQRQQAQWSVTRQAPCPIACAKLHQTDTNFLLQPHPPTPHPQVAAGSSSSTVTLYDLASGRLLAVQCLLAGPGSVQAMAAWVPLQLLAQANLAPGGPLAPDGGGVLTAAGLGGFGLEAEHECAGVFGWTRGVGAQV